MATIGTDCDFTLQHASVNGGTALGFYLASENEKAFQVHRPRVRSKEYSAAGALVYTDIVVGKREWHLTVIARSGMTKYDGTVVATTPAAFKSNLAAFYALVKSTITFVDPAGTSYSVYFDDWVERMPELPKAEWEIDIVLLEA